jgi:hypothetical protein
MVLNIQIKSVVLGFVVACVVAVSAVVACFFLIGSQIRSVSHGVLLPSGKTISVTSCDFAWGVEHDERIGSRDSFVLEYVSTVPHTDAEAVDKETLDTFELIRPISELWGLDVASVSAFPSKERKGRYFLYAFARSSDGTWSFERKQAKVFVND